VLLDLPSRPDRYLPVRMMTSRDSHYEVLIGEGLLEVEPDGPWLEENESLVAALLRLEPSRSWEAARVGVARLKEHVGREEARVRYAYENFLEEVILPRMGEDASEIPKRLSPEEFESIIAERIGFWNEHLQEEEWRQGVQEGEATALLRLLERRFGLLDQGTRDRIADADADLLMKWIDSFPAAESLTDVFSG
jgi:hypothetical protein